MCAASFDEDGRAERVVEHCSNETTLDVATGIAECVAALKPDLNSATFLIRLNQLPTESFGTGRRGELIEDTHGTFSRIEFVWRYDNAKAGVRRPGAVNVRRVFGRYLVKPSNSKPAVAPDLIRGPAS
jgi:hypothetical protein